MQTRTEEYQADVTREMLCPQTVTDRNDIPFSDLSHSGKKILIFFGEKKFPSVTGTRGLDDVYQSLEEVFNDVSKYM